MCIRDRSRVIDDPYGLLHAVRGEIIYRLALGDLIDDLVDLGAGAIGQEDGAGISIAAVDMLAAVLFFIGAGQLVLADDIVEIIIDRSAADNTGLGAAVHDPVSYTHLDVYKRQVGILIILVQVIQSVGDWVYRKMKS